METEPISLVGESVSEMAHEVPVLPNGSSMTSIKSEVQSEKLTTEKLQDIEDEEILDKMVLHFPTDILNTRISIIYNHTIS